MSALNEVTGSAYQGKNVMRLLVAEAEHDYSSEHGWAGFTQWIKAGRCVRKGEHGTACMTVVKVGGDSDGKGAKTAPRGFRVFHFDQTVQLGAETERAPILERVGLTGLVRDPGEDFADRCSETQR